MTLVGRRFYKWRHEKLKQRAFTVLFGRDVHVGDTEHFTWVFLFFFSFSLHCPWKDSEWIFSLPLTILYPNIRKYFYWVKSKLPQHHDRSTRSIYTGRCGPWDNWEDGGYVPSPGVLFFTQHLSSLSSTAKTPLEMIIVTLEITVYNQRVIRLLEERWRSKPFSWT